MPHILKKSKRRRGQILTKTEGGDRVYLDYRRPDPLAVLAIRADLGVLGVQERRYRLELARYYGGQTELERPPALRVLERNVVPLIEFVWEHLIEIGGLVDEHDAPLDLSDLELADFEELVVALGLPELIRVATTIANSDGLEPALFARFRGWIEFVGMGKECNCPRCEGHVEEFEECAVAPFEPVDELNWLYGQWELYCRDAGAAGLPMWLVQVHEVVLSVQRLRTQQRAEEREMEQLAAEYGGGA